jgi:glucokinase-like ROK family protein
MEVGMTRPDSRSQVALLRVLRDEGPRSRAELGDLTGLTRPKLMAEIARLEQLGLVRHGGQAASRGGRRSTMVSIDPHVRFVAVAIGATSIDVAVTDGHLGILDRRSEAADVRQGPKVVLRRVAELVNKLRAEHGKALTGIGIGVPGPVRFPDGVLVSPPLMPGWNRYPVRDNFARKYGCPVLVDNDVNVMAVGEQWGGVARSVDNFLFVKIGTGIGCGIVVHGEVYRGIDGCAGDIGHINVDPDGPVCACGNTGCLDSVFSGAALSRDATAAAGSGSSPVLAARLEQHGTVTPIDVADAAAEGDPVAVRLIRQGGRRLGLVLSGLVGFMNPSLIVIGGGLSNLGHVLLADIRGVVYRRSLPMASGNLPIVLSELGETAGVIGAAATISDHVFRIS